VSIRVAVLGAAGRMGSTVCDAVTAASDCELVACVDSGDPLDEVIDAGADVAVEFTLPDAVKGNAAWLLERGVHTVVGATGLSDEDLAELEARTGPASLFVAPNFSLGAVLSMRLAEEVAPYLPECEITETHHPGKADAPSGTAARTARLVAGARTAEVAPPGPDGHPARGEILDGVPVHSLRLPGFLASQEVVFGGEGQTLTLRHDATDRSAFMPGVLLAVRRVADRPGLTVGLEALL
jgi:4-hydroxy-tetrahydrodipicolinate reductase